MSWISPELIEILLTILKAVVILLVVVTCGAFMSFGERRNQFIYDSVNSQSGR